MALKRQKGKLDQMLKPTKAFLSHHAGNCHCDGCKTFNYNPIMALIAIDEASYILGEVEPQEADYMTDTICIERLQGSGRRDLKGATWPSPYCIALVESLTNFCQMEEF